MHRLAQKALDRFPAVGLSVAIGKCNGLPEISLVMRSSVRSDEYFCICASDQLHANQDILPFLQRSIPDLLAIDDGQRAKAPFGVLLKPTDSKGNALWDPSDQKRIVEDLKQLGALDDEMAETYGYGSIFNHVDNVRYLCMKAKTEVPEWFREKYGSKFTSSVAERSSKSFALEQI